MCRKCRHLSEGKFSFGSLFDNDTKQTNLASTVKWLAQKNCNCVVPVRISRVRKHSKLNFRFDLKKFSKKKNIFSFVFAMCTFHLSAEMHQHIQSHALPELFSLRCDYDDVDDIQRSGDLGNENAFLLLFLFPLFASHLVASHNCRPRFTLLLDLLSLFCAPRVCYMHKDHAK